MVCSPDLTDEEIGAFDQGYEWRNRVDQSLLLTIKNALSNVAESPAWHFIATLIANNNLDIRIAFKPGHMGIFHDKLGLFADKDGDAISFVGSANETASAWDLFGNHEFIEVFCSWTPDADRVSEHHAYFERLWQNGELGVETIPFPEVAKELLVTSANPDGPDAAFEVVLQREIRPSGKSPQLHQVRAVTAWEANGYRGILAHATGSGKTFTAILAIRDWLQKRGPVLILVPSELLMSQWFHELSSSLCEEVPSILKAGAGSTSWKRPYVVEGFTQLHGGPRVTLATIQTASDQVFLNKVMQGDHLLVVWDEVHWAGAPHFSSTLRLNAGGKLGLSATPRRYGDPEGTKRILDSVGQVVDSVTLADAIEIGRLCRYNYYVHPVELTDEESVQWRRLTWEINKQMGALPVS
jgi:hypothetical protein